MGSTTAALVAALGASSITASAAVVLACIAARNSRALLTDERRARAQERSEDRAEWYRHAVYERRLTAVQEAYTWLMRLNVALNRARTGGPGDPVSAELSTLANQAREWYDANALWMHGKLPRTSAFIGLCNAAGAHSSGRDGEVRKHFNDAVREITEYAEELTREAHQAT